jgi:hypothetical protein
MCLVELSLLTKRVHPEVNADGRQEGTSSKGSAREEGRRTSDEGPVR